MVFVSKSLIKSHQIIAIVVIIVTFSIFLSVFHFEIMDKIVIKFLVILSRIVIINKFCGGFVVGFVDKIVIEFLVSKWIIIIFNIIVGNITGRRSTFFEDGSSERENFFKEKMLE